MTERKCRICGCTDDHACMTPEGPCHWVFDDYCSACVIELPPGQNMYEGNVGMLVEKMCRNCAHLISRPHPLYSAYRMIFTCERDRFNSAAKDQSIRAEGYHYWFAWRGITRPNKTVAAAQRKCPSFEVHPRYLKHED